MNKQQFKKRLTTLNITTHDRWGFTLLIQVLVILALHTLINQDPSLIWRLFFWVCCITMIIQIVLFVLTSEQSGRETNHRS